MADHRTALSEITNTRPVFRRTTTKSPEEKSTPPKSPSESRFNVSWSRDLVLEFLWWPLGPWTLELSSDHPNLIPILEQNRNWIILFVKDFSDSWKPGVKYEARLRPRADLCGVSQKLFLSHPSLHSCVVVEGRGYLWLNRLEDEPFLRGNWLEDATASARILPPLNLCLDLDDTLIFNAPVADCPVNLDYVVRDPPHLLVDDPDPSGDICPSDSPFVRPYIVEFLQLICPFFRNVRMATFSVQARAREIARHMDPTCRTLQKNYQPDPITGQKPVANTIFARELLLQQGHCLSQQERNQIKSGSVFWLKSLEMLDLPKKGLYQRSLILDDRADVWVQSVQDNIVKISGPDKPMNIGDPKYINGFNGGELGQRLLLAIINLELKSTGSRAYLEHAHGLPIPSPKRMSGHSSLNSIPTSPFVHPTPPKIPNPSIHTPARPNTLAATASPPNKAPRSSAVAGFSHARDREQREREQMRERGLTHPRPVTHKPESWGQSSRWDHHKYDINTTNRIPFAPLVYIS